MFKKYFSKLGLVLVILYIGLIILALYTDSKYLPMNEQCLDICIRIPHFYLMMLAFPLWMVLGPSANNLAPTQILIYSLVYHLLAILVLYFIGFGISKAFKKNV